MLTRFTVTSVQDVCRVPGQRCLLVQLSAGKTKRKAFEHSPLPIQLIPGDVVDVQVEESKRGVLVLRPGNCTRVIESSGEMKRAHLADAKRHAGHSLWNPAGWSPTELLPASSPAPKQESLLNDRQNNDQKEDDEGMDEPEYVKGSKGGLFKPLPTDVKRKRTKKRKDKK